MTNNNKRTAVWVGLMLATALFFPFAWVMPRQSLFGVEDSAIICTALAIAVICTRGAGRALRRPLQQINRGQSLLSGMFLASLALAMIFAGQWYWRLMTKPDWVADSLPVAFSRWLLEAGLIVALVGLWSTQSIVLAGGAYQRSAVIVAVSVFLATLVILWMSLGM